MMAELSKSSVAGTIGGGASNICFGAAAVVGGDVANWELGLISGLVLPLSMPRMVSELSMDLLSRSSSTSMGLSGGSSLSR